MIEQRLVSTENDVGLLSIGSLGTIFRNSIRNAKIFFQDHPWNGAVLLRPEYVNYHNWLKKSANWQKAIRCILTFSRNSCRLLHKHQSKMDTGPFLAAHHVASSRSGLNWGFDNPWIWRFISVINKKITSTYYTHLIRSGQSVKVHTYYFRAIL